MNDYAPAKHDLTVAVSKKDALIFDVGRDLGFFGYLCATNGARVRFFNRSANMGRYIAATLVDNDIGGASVIDAVFDDGKREMWLSPIHHVNRGPSENGRTLQTETTSIDQYISERPDQVPSALVIDDPAYETRIIKGAIRTLRAFKPDLIITCYRHGAFANGAPVIELMRVLDEIGYSLKICNWNGGRGELKPLDEIVEPDLDVFLIYGQSK